MICDQCETVAHCTKHGCVPKKDFWEGYEPEPVRTDAWPCLIAEADFQQNTITLEMQCSDYKVGVGQHWLHTTPPAQEFTCSTGLCHYKPAAQPAVPLTDEQIVAANYPDGEENGATIAAPDFELIAFARDIEAKLRSKNND